jgi:hypothetical protein
MDSGNGYVERAWNVAPLVGDFLLLFVPEMMEALGILALSALYVWILVSIGCGTAIASTSLIAAQVSEYPSYGILSAILASVIAALIGAMIGLFAWMIRDRLGWSEQKKQIEVNTDRINKLENTVEQTVTEREHKELIDSLRASTKRIDDLYEKMSGKAERPDYDR